MWSLFAAITCITTVYSILISISNNSQHPPLTFIAVKYLQPNNVYVFSFFQFSHVILTLTIYYRVRKTGSYPNKRKYRKVSESMSLTSLRWTCITRKYSAGLLLPNALDCILKWLQGHKIWMNFPLVASDFLAAAEAQEVDKTATTEIQHLLRRCNMRGRTTVKWQYECMLYEWKDNDDA